MLLIAVFALCGAAMAQTYHYDVNGDGVVTSVDVTVLYDYLLGNDVPSYVSLDVDGDGVVTSTDITVLYDYLLGNVPSGDSHEWVDLGLPSGTLWATMNVGASKPEDYGDYFAWGETTPKDVYEWSTYKWCMGDWYQLTKYCDNSNFGYNGFVDNKTELDSEDDAATANWGLGWRMPSSEQMQELCNNCTSEWTTRNGVNGRLFTSNINGASLFLPAAGCGWGFGLFGDGSDGYYWSRTLDGSYPSYAYGLYLCSSNVSWDYGYERYFGSSVRAVRVSQK